MIPPSLSPSPTSAAGVRSSGRGMLPPACGSTIPNSSAILITVHEAQISEAPLMPPTIPSETWLEHCIKGVCARLWQWISGPKPVQTVQIKPVLPHIQSYPYRTLRLLFPRQIHRVGLLLLFWLLWISGFTTIIHYSRFLGSVGGAPDPPYTLSCTQALWGKNAQCGLNGELCLPFDNASFAFRCPAGCIGSGQVLNPRAVGALEVAYTNFVVGGPSGGREPMYRADSFICPAAIHAGIVSDRFGGCGVLSRIGTNRDFLGSLRNDIQSFPFDSDFPSTYTFIPASSSDCVDLRWHLFAISIPFTVLILLFTSSVAIHFFSIFIGVFWHVSLGSDPPYTSSPYELISLSLSRFLPAAFIAFTLYKYIIHPTLSPSSANVTIEKILLWLGPLWVGALDNITLSPHIPLQRLTPNDLSQQPGAKAALAIIIIIIFFAALTQIYHLRSSGKLPFYLALYAGFGTGLGLLAAIPGCSLRIHHYILSLLLLPGTALQTRPSLVFQGLLVGLFINGTARWGFASILETPTALRGKDGLTFSLIPNLHTPVLTAENVTFSWDPIQEGGDWDGVSVLINDVERFRGREEEREFTWNWTIGEKLYVRVGFWEGAEEGDFSKAGIVGVDGSWTEIEVGLT
ncbi:hypothetical protein RUND412_010844 [Rhizina undulata]